MLTPAIGFADSALLACGQWWRWHALGKPRHQLITWEKDHAGAIGPGCFEFQGWGNFGFNAATGEFGDIAARTIPGTPPSRSVMAPVTFQSNPRMAGWDRNPPAELGDSRCTRSSGPWDAAALKG